MILFVFEGEKREPALFKAIERLFFKDGPLFLFDYFPNG